MYVPLPGGTERTADSKVAVLQVAFMLFIMPLYIMFFPPGSACVAVPDFDLTMLRVLCALQLASKQAAGLCRWERVCRVHHKPIYIR